MHDLAVLEMDLSQRAADLRAQLDPVDGGELAEEAGPGIDLALQRLADCHRQSGRGYRPRLVGVVRRKGEPCKQEDKHRRGTDRGRSKGSPSARARGPLIERFSWCTLRGVGDLIHETFRKSLPGRPEPATGARLWLHVEGWCRVVSMRKWKTAYWD